MCESTPENEWRPFYFMDLNRFPGVEERNPMFAQLEACPHCTETRIHPVNPENMRVVRGEMDLNRQEETESADSGDAESEESEIENVGRDLERPGDI